MGVRSSGKHVWDGLHVNVTLCCIICFYIFSIIIDLSYYDIDFHYDIYTR